MSGHATLTLVGNLTADPELRITTGGDPVASFTVAATPRILDRGSGEWSDGDPFTCVARPGGNWARTSLSL